jgi:hypothetical protein
VAQKKFHSHNDCNRNGKTENERVPVGLIGITGQRQETYATDKGGKIDMPGNQAGKLPPPEVN